MTSVSVCHSPVSWSWTRLRERNDRSAATARYSGSSSSSTMPPMSWIRCLFALQEAMQLVGGVVDEGGAFDACLHGDLAEDARSRVAHRHVLPGSGAGYRRWCVRGGRSAEASWMELQVRAHPLPQEHGVMSLEHPLSGAVPDGP